jgi:hypothetical protein
MHALQEGLIESGKKITVSMMMEATRFNRSIILSSHDAATVRRPCTAWDNFCSQL